MTSYSSWYKKQQSDITNYKLDKIQMSFFEGLNKDSILLEIGSGSGGLLKRLKDLGFNKLSAIEIDEELCEIAESISGVRPISTSSDKIHEVLAKKHGTIDCIIMLDVLEHVPLDYQNTLISNISMALKSGGAFLVRVPNANSPLGLRMRYIDFTHVCAYTELSLNYLMDSYFSDVSFYPAQLGTSIGVKNILRRMSYLLSSFAWRMIIFGYIGSDSFKLIDTPNIYAVMRKKL